MHKPVTFSTHLCATIRANGLRFIQRNQSNYSATRRIRTPPIKGVLFHQIIPHKLSKFNIRRYIHMILYYLIRQYLFT